MASVILPAGPVLNARKMALAVTNAMNAAAKAAKADFEVTTRTWQAPVEFTIENTGPYTRIVGTTNKVYIFVNGGTKPHLILPRKKKILTWSGSNYRPKTRPGKIKSNKGSNDNTIVVARHVNHPGTEPRDFDKAIAEKWQKELPVLMQRAIDSAIGP